MKNITPEYFSYRQRIVGGLPKVLIFSLFIVIFIFLTDVSVYRIAAFVCLGGLIILNGYKLFKRSKSYIKSIEFSETQVRITIIDKENTTTIISSGIEDVRIRMVELFFGFDRIGRNFKLQIDIRKNGKFEKVFDQYEIGGWNLKLFKESCDLYMSIRAATSLDL